MTGGEGGMPTVAVIGAGVSGLCVGAKLKMAGVDDFVIYERAEEVGGVWRDNTYPGLCCDIPSRNYSYSFAPNAEWSRYFSEGPEIRRYLNRVADEHGLRPHIRTGQEVVRASFDQCGWRVETASGEIRTFDFLLCATGLLVHPRIPDFPGLQTFAGAVFHSARWDHSVELAGRRVAIVGTGSTGVQLTCALAETSGRLMLFQRTPQWVFPKPNKRYSVWTKAVHRFSPRFSRAADRTWRAAFEATVSRAAVAPGWQRSLIGWGCRLALRQVRSTELRRRLTPDYQPMCKRLVVASGFYRAVQRDNVEVVCEPIERVTASGIVTRDGREHEADVIVLATGFRADAYMRPMEVVGLDGRTLAEAWADGPRAYRTVALPGFPNLFMLVGPNSPFSSESVLRTAETQADYIMRWISLFRAGKIIQAVPTDQATAAFNATLAGALPRTVFASGCASWYQDARGAPMVWPWTVREHRRMLARLEFADFDILPGPQAGSAGQRTELGSRVSS